MDHYHFYFHFHFQKLYSIRPDPIRNLNLKKTFWSATGGRSADQIWNLSLRARCLCHQIVAQVIISVKLILKGVSKFLKGVMVVQTVRKFL